MYGSFEYSYEQKNTRCVYAANLTNSFPKINLLRTQLNWTRPPWQTIHKIHYTLHQASCYPKSLTQLSGMDLSMYQIIFITADPELHQNCTLETITSKCTEKMVLLTYSALLLLFQICKEYTGKISWTCVMENQKHKLITPQIDAVG